MYTEEDYLAYIMGRRRALEEARAERSHREELPTRLNPRKKQDVNANRMSEMEMLPADQIKSEPADSGGEMLDLLPGAIADGTMRVIGQVVKLDPELSTSTIAAVDEESEDMALDLSQQRSSLEPECDEALDLSTTKERREYRPETALDLSKKSFSSSESSSSETTPETLPETTPETLPQTPSETSPETENLPIAAADTPPETPEAVLENPPASPTETLENAPPNPESNSLVAPEGEEEKKEERHVEGSSEFLCGICQKPCDNLTDLGKHTMDHVKAVKQQQARIKKAEQEQKKSIQQKKKQDKANQRLSKSSPLKEVPVLNTNVELATEPQVPIEKPLKPRATATKKAMKEREEQFECHLCKTSFGSMRALGVHNRTHPKCKFCQKQLTDKDALKNHVCPEAEQQQREVAQAKQAKLISWLMNAGKKSPKKENCPATVSKPPNEEDDSHQATVTEAEISPVKNLPEDLPASSTVPKDVPVLSTVPEDVPLDVPEEVITQESGAPIKTKSNTKKPPAAKTTKRRSSKETEQPAVIFSNSSEKKVTKKTSKKKSPTRQLTESVLDSDVTTVTKSPPKKRKRAASKQVEEPGKSNSTSETIGSKTKKKDKGQNVVIADIHAAPANHELDQVSLKSGSSESAADENNPIPKKRRKTQQKIQWLQMDVIDSVATISTAPPAKETKSLQQKENAIESTTNLKPEKPEAKKRATKSKQASPKTTETANALTEIVPSQGEPLANGVSVKEEAAMMQIGAPKKPANPRGRPRKNPILPLTEEELTCKACGNRFGNIGLLKNHIKSHRWQNPHICGSCGLVFKCALEVKEHNKIHNANKPFKCNECDSAFTRRFFLELHLRSHTGEKPFNCDLCQKAFAQSSQLKIHKRIHMGDKPNKCTICNATFVMASKLKDHMRVHSGDRPYSCDQCGKTFAQAYYLKIHLRTHSGAKPFKCSICGTGFRQSCHVVIHMRTHTKENPYSCADCGMTFRHSPVLKKHRENGCQGKPNTNAVKAEVKA